VLFLCPLVALPSCSTAAVHMSLFQKVCSLNPDPGLTILHEIIRVFTRDLQENVTEKFNGADALRTCVLEVTARNLVWVAGCPH
jgi:hypothetical protein